MNQRSICAWHEAGHVVCGMCVGYIVSSAVLFDVNAAGMQARTRYATGFTKCQTAWADLAVTLAGPLAESIATARDLLDVLNEGRDFEHSDICRARREAQRLWRLHLYHSPDHALLVAEQRARAMLKSHWRFVAQTAATLCAQGRIE